MGYERQDTPRIQAARQLARLIKSLDEGKITSDAFEIAVKGLAQRMDDVVTTKAANDVMKDRQRGADIVREKLIRARRQGDLDNETVEFALWALDQNPALADNLGISVRAQKDDQATGDYNPAAEIIRLFKVANSGDVAVHEILHHAERMMPQDMQDAIRKEWAKTLAAAIKRSTPEQVEALKLIPNALAGDKAAYQLLTKAIIEGPLNYAEHYQLVNPSEFWAVNGSRILGNKFLSKDSTWLRVRDWMRNMAQTIKGILGLRSDAPVLKALAYVTDRENFGVGRGGRFESDKMLSDFEAITAAGGSLQNISRAPGARFALDAANNLGPALDALQKEQAARDKILARVPPRARDAFTDIRNLYKKTMPWVLTNFQLAQEFGGKMGALTNYVALMDAAKKERTRMQMEFHDAAVEWDALPPAVKTRLDALMQRATLRQVHPDRPFDHADNAHLRRKDPVADQAAKTLHQQMAAQYDGLGKPAQQVYQRANKTLENSWKLRAASYKKLVDATYSERLAEAMAKGNAELAEKLRLQGEAAEKDYATQLKSMVGPYFPLMRFGDYLAIGESDAYLEAKLTMENATGETRTKARQKLDVMKRDGKHYVVSAHESRADAERAAKEYGASGLNSRNDMAGLKVDQLRSVTQDTMKHLEDAVDAKVDKEHAGAVKAAMQQVFLQGLPEMHALRREAQRKGVEGANADMLRAFAAAGQSNAFYASRLQYAKQLADTMFQMKAEVKGDLDLSHVHREMQKRMALDMKFMETPVQDFLSSMSWLYYLGVSPAAVLINTAQPYLVTAPVLAGRFGLAAATREVARASRDSLMVLKAARYKDKKWDWWSGINEESIAGPSRNEDRAAIRSLLQRGILDDGMQHENAMFAQDSSRGVAKINRVAGWATQQVEVANRLTTALASFRLARKHGMSEAEAQDYAYQQVQGTQFDYSAEGSARIMREGGGILLAKLVFQFRRYQQGMLYLLVSNIRKSFGTGEDAKHARSTVAYLSMATGLAAGSLGLPFAGIGFAVADVFMDDDDLRGDAETRFRNVLFDMTGDKKAAEVIAKGLPALFHLDVSQRIGLGSIANPFPMARWGQAKTGRDTVSEMLMNAAGPSAGLAAQMADGLRLMASGDFVKGAEKMVPKVMTDVSKALRYKFGDGMTDPRGDQILGPDEINSWDALVRSWGFSSTTESNYYQGTIAKSRVKMAYEDRRNALGNEFKNALRDGDMADVRKAIKEFNADHPQRPVLPKDEIGWRKDVAKRQSERGASGIRIDPKRDKDYEAITRFAR